jgi:hypothetical protein
MDAHVDPDEMKRRKAEVDDKISRIADVSLVLVKNSERDSEWHDFNKWGFPFAVTARDRILHSVERAMDE